MMGIPILARQNLMPTGPFVIVFRFTLDQCRTILLSDIMFWVQYVETCCNDMAFGRLALCTFMVFSLISKEMSAVDYSTLNITSGDLGDMGLTEIPTGILPPCHINGELNILNNLITRIENDSFKCLNKVDTLFIGSNLITYIAPGAFDPMVSLIHVGLTGNKDLAELPPHYGPNTVNMIGLYIADINLQIIPPGLYSTKYR